MDNREEMIACLTLLTRAAREEGLPPPLTRAMYYEMASAGARENLVLRDTDSLADCALIERARMLLGFCAEAANVLEKLEAQGYTMILPQDSLWPRALFSLGRQMPPFLLLRGNVDLLSKPKAAVAGSRDILPSTQRLAAQTGVRLAKEGFVMVCGGARGVDDAAQRAILGAGGSLILVPAMPVENLLARCEYLRNALDQGKLLIVCDALPEESFSAAKALTRNHTIYALGCAAIVVAARNGLGGSWRGAKDCLRMNAAPVFVLPQENEDMQGNTALLMHGARLLNGDQRLDQQIMACRNAEQTDLFSAEGSEAIK